MTFEDNLAKTLHASAHAVPVRPAPTEAVIQRGRAMRRRRKTARAAGLAAVLAPCTLLAGLQITATASTPTQPMITAAQPTKSAAARVVRAGERIDAGRGYTVWLTKENTMVVEGPGTHRKQKPIFGPTGPNNLRAGGVVHKSGNLYAGAYEGKVARATVKLGEVTLNAKVITLAGNPGWAAFYVNGPSTAGVKDWPARVITVYAADGTALASSTSPASNR
ncbi:hypothetical protein [Streptomyces sp. NPDC055709]